MTPQVISDPERPTGTACIMVDTDTGENAIVVSPGAAGACLKMTWSCSSPFLGVPQWF